MKVMVSIMKAGKAGDSVENCGITTLFVALTAAVKIFLFFQRQRCSSTSSTLIVSLTLSNNNELLVKPTQSINDAKDIDDDYEQCSR